MNEKEPKNFNFDALKENKDLFVNKTNTSNQQKSQVDINKGLIGYLNFLNLIILLIHLTILIMILIQEKGNNALETIKSIIMSLLMFVPVIFIASILGYVLKQNNNLWMIIKELINKKEMDK